MDKLDLSQSESPAERENFRKIDEEFQRSPLLNGQWKLLVLEFESANTYTIKHRLGFVPTDLIETYKTANVTYNYSSFTKEEISITTTGAANVRILIGRMK